MKLSSSAREFVRFAMVGVLATGLHYGIYYLLQYLLPKNDLYANIAYTAGYLLSLVANFYLTAYFTFGTRPSWKRAGGFGGAHAVNYGLHFCLFNLFLWLGVPRALAPLPVFAIAVPVNFVLVRLVFKRIGKK